VATPLNPIVGFEHVQVKRGQNLVTGALCVDEDGTVRFWSEEAQANNLRGMQPHEAVKGALGEFEEVGTPEARPDA
jgi:hypothetical protein